MTTFAGCLNSSWLGFHWDILQEKYIASTFLKPFDNVSKTVMKTLGYRKGLSIALENMRKPPVS